jgi:hypothetical protein
MGDDLTDLALIALGVLLGLSAVLRAAGNLAAWATGTSLPTGGALAGLGVLAHPTNPAMDQRRGARACRAGGGVRPGRDAPGGHLMILDEP